MSYTYVTDIESVQAHQDSRFGRAGSAGSGRGARAESSLTIIARALRRGRDLDQGAGRQK